MKRTVKALLVPFGITAGHNNKDNLKYTIICIYFDR